MPGDVREQPNEGIQSIDAIGIHSIDTINVAVAESLLIRAATVDAEGVITDYSTSWEHFVQGAADPLLSGVSIGSSIVDHFHLLAVSGNLYARDALVRLLSVLQGVKQYATLDYPPASRGQLLRLRITFGQLSAPVGGALITQITLNENSLAPGQTTFPRVQALARLMGADHVAVWEFVGRDPPKLSLVRARLEDLVVEGEARPASGVFAEILSEGYGAYPSGVRKSFPDDEWMEKWELESCVGSPLYDSSGEPVGVIAVLSQVPLDQDSQFEIPLKAVAAQVSTRLELGSRLIREDEAGLDLFRTIFESSDQPILIFNSEGELLEINASARSIVEDKLGLPRSPHLPELVGGDADMQEMRDALAASGAWSSPRLLRAPNGELVNVQIDLRQIERARVPIYEAVVHLVSDLASIPTPLDAADSELVAMIPCSIFRINADGVCIDYSPGRLAPILWAGSPIGRSVHEVLPPDLAQMLLSMITAALESHQTQADELTFEYRGQSYFRGVRVVPASNKEVLLILRDYTAERTTSLERERQAKMQELEGKAEHLMVRHNPYGLTFRELSVLHLVVEGFGDKEIARRLGVSIFTVNKHVAKVLEKMGASSRTEAAVRAAREDLVL